MRGMCGCGISKVHFLGELQDWKEVRSKIKRMGSYDDVLKAWSGELDTVIENFIKTYKGDSNADFWN